MTLPDMVGFAPLYYSGRMARWAEVIRTGRSHLRDRYDSSLDLCRRFKKKCIDP